MSNMLLIPSKSRYEMELEKWQSEEIVRTRFKSEQVLNYIKESHDEQKKNIKRIAEKIGYEKIIDRSLLNQETIVKNDIFVFLGGDNHFSYCAQEILRYNTEHLEEVKHVIGVVLDPKKSLGTLLFLTRKVSWINNSRYNL